MEWFDTAMANPLVRITALLAGGLILVAIIGRVLRSRRDARILAQRRDDVRKQRGYLYMQQQEVERLAASIIATSQTQSIPGYLVLRQVEALFTDGHVAPPHAVQALKAIAAEKNANAIINLRTERLPNGKCTASGDAVVVRSSAVEPG